jgi:hypothetical protein
VAGVTLTQAQLGRALEQRVACGDQLLGVADPFNYSRTLTICNGVHSRGVVGAVLIVTDETVRPDNEKYLARRFPEGSFAMLVRVPVVSGKVLAPDLQNPYVRVFEWTPESLPMGE